MTDITITIVAYEDRKDVIKAVSSIERYTSSELTKKIYIVDNSEVPLDFSDAFAGLSDVEVFHPDKNLGFGGGHNYVLPKLASKYHAIVNPDIELKEDSFKAIIDYLDSSSCGMVIPRLVDSEGKRQAACRRELTVTDMFIRMFVKGGFKKRRALHTMEDMDYSKAFEVPFAQGSFLVLKTELFKQLNGFDERYFMYMEDADLCKRVWQLAPVMYFPGTEVVHRWEKGSHKSKKLLFIHIKSMIKYFNKWGWKF